MGRGERVRRSRWVVVGVVVCVASLSALSGASASVRAVKSCSTHGGLETCAAAARIHHPQALFVKVLSQPHQRASVFWQEVCSNGSRSVYRSGRFQGVTPIRRRIAMPFAVPDSCMFSAQGHLFHDGSLRVVLQAEVP